METPMQRAEKQSQWLHHRKKFLPAPLYYFFGQPERLLTYTELVAELRKRTWQYRNPE